MKKLAIILTLAFLALVGIHFLLSPSVDEFAEGDLLDEIKSRGKVRIGINPNSKPFGFLDAKGNYVGYDVDLARYIAQNLVNNPQEIEFIKVTPSNRLLKASTGEADMVISTITITPQRQQIVSFSVPYDMAGQALLVRSKSDITSMSDLNGENVGVIFGTTAERNIKNLVPNANLLGFRSYNDAYKALKNGKIDAITSDDTILSRYAIDDPSVKLLSKRYSKEPYGIAFKKGESTVRLQEELNLIIEDLQRKNVIPRLRQKWDIGD